MYSHTYLWPRLLLKQFKSFENKLSRKARSMGCTAGRITCGDSQGKPQCHWEEREQSLRYWKSAKLLSLPPADSPVSEDQLTLTSFANGSGCSRRIVQSEYFSPGSTPQLKGETENYFAVWEKKAPFQSPGRTEHRLPVAPLI